jgi:hypothetical protein
MRKIGFEGESWNGKEYCTTTGNTFTVANKVKYLGAQLTLNKSQRTKSMKEQILKVMKSSMQLSRRDRGLLSYRAE